MKTNGLSNLGKAYFLMSLLVSAGCSTESAKQSAYEAMQNHHQLQCQKNPTADCPKGETYDAYQKQLKELGPPAQ
jgi:hypothetical protein